MKETANESKEITLEDAARDAIYGDRDALETLVRLMKVTVTFNLL
jgi:hypothetical protein